MRFASKEKYVVKSRVPAVSPMPALRKALEKLMQVCVPPYDEGTALLAANQTIEVLRHPGQTDACLSPCWQDPRCGPFLRPVDPIEDGVPDYFKIISQPMDLGTVSARLKGGVYVTPQALREAVARVWRNSLLFNGEGSVMRSLTGFLDGAPASQGK